MCSGRPCNFDGVDDYVEIADAPELDISGPEFSASLWVKPDRGPGTEDMFFMKGDRQGIGNVNYYLSWKDTGKMTWAFKSDGGFEYLDMDVTLPTVDEWNHIAVVFDRPTVSIYINGTEYTSSVGTGGTSMDKDLVANDEPLWIGAGRDGGSIVTPGNYSAPFSGAIDEFAIYDRALTAAEIETIRTSQPAAATANAFTLDENSANSTVVGTVAASDQDAGDTLSYSITGGNTGGAFAIGANGTITVANSAALDFETNPTFTLTIEATDDGTPNESDTTSVSITLNDVNDAPVARPDGVHLSFDGDDFVEVADHPSLQMTNKVTMEAWINPDGTGTGSKIIVNKEGEYELGITAETGEIKFAIARPDNTWAWHNTGYFVTAGEWTHVAVTYDGVAGEAKTYINGELVDTFSQSGVIGDVYAGLNNLWIGGRQNDPLDRFHGQIDDVRVWSTTRTLGEIQANKDGQLGGAEVGLVGNWRLDEAAGGAVIDQSAFGNDGVLGGSEGAAAIPTYQGYVTDQNTVLNIAAGAGVLANDTDVDSGSLTVTNLDTTGMLGILVLNTADGSFSYDPNGAFDYLDVGEQATETFTYTANDGSLDSNIVTATITITGVNDAATIGGVDVANLTEDTGAANGYLTATGTLTASDVDNPDNTFTAASHRGSLGDLTIDGSGNWTYTVDNSLPGIQGLAAGSTVNDVITVSSIDGTTHDITITITGNAAPTAVNDAYTVDEDGTLAVDWWDADWSRRSVITFDNSGQAETLTDAPVLVILNGGNINYTLTKDDGSDLRFFDANGNALAYDIEEWNESGDSYVWVKVPQITGGSNTDTITMYWGNALRHRPRTLRRSGAMAMPRCITCMTISTMPRCSATPARIPVLRTRMGRSVTVSCSTGADDFVSLGDDASIQNIFDGGGTVSAWIYATGWGEGDYGRIFDKSGNTLPSNTGWALELYGGAECAAVPGRLLRHHGAVVHGYQQHQPERLDPCLAYLRFLGYVGRAQDLHQWRAADADRRTATQPTGTVGSDVGYDLTVGNHAAATSRTFDGVIDSVQISSTARSADWIKAQHLATSGLFASVGPEQSFGTTAGVLDNDTAPDPHPPRATSLDTTGTIGLVTLNDDGTFTYDTNGQFEYLAAGVDATDTFSYTLDDGVNAPTVATVTMTVTGANDAPTVTAIGDQTIAEDGSTGALAFTVGDAETAVGSLSVTASSSDQSLIADGSLSLVDGGSGNWTIQATPLSNQHGTATITVTVDDGTTTTVETFDVTVTSVVDLTSADDSFSTDEDVVLNADVSGNDSTTSGGEPELCGGHGCEPRQPDAEHERQLHLHADGGLCGVGQLQLHGDGCGERRDPARRRDDVTVDAVNDEPSFSCAGQPECRL